MGTPTQPGVMEPGATDVPVVRLNHLHDFDPQSGRGALRYQADLRSNIPLEALLLNNQSAVLVVALHGAMSAARTQLPRFEWLRTLSATEYSSLYFSDATLRLDQDLKLSWYMGWREVDLFPVMARWVLKAKSAVGASQVVILGSSGGGYAALQLATYVPGSLAIPFNPQTRLNKYEVLGSRKVQGLFVDRVMPHLAPKGFAALEQTEDWTMELGDRASVIRRYLNQVDNFVLYAQNLNDEHHYTSHYLPFMRAIEGSPNVARVSSHLYEGPESHGPPRPKVFHEVLTRGLEMLSDN